MKKIILPGLIFCALSAAVALDAVASVPQGGGRGSVYYRDGVRYALEGRLEEAAAAFEQVVRLDPKNGDAYFSLGNIYSEQGRWADAVEAYRLAVVLKKKDGEAYNGLGVALGGRGDYEQAAAALKTAIEIFPDWAEPRFHLSQVYRKLGQEVAAQVAYSEALERRPDYASYPPRSFTSPVANPRVGPRVERAATTATKAPAPARAATPPRAVETANRETRREAEDAVSPYELGLRHSRAGRYDEAVAALTQAVRMDRNNAGAYSALGNAYARLGLWRNSVDAYEQATRLDPKDANAFEMLGRSYAKLRETTAKAPSAGDNETATGVEVATNSGASANGATTRETRAPAAAETRPPAADDADPSAVYRVGPGDVLEVRVPDARGQQTNAYTVTPTGLLDDPRLGEPLKVHGLTTGEIEARLGAELKRRGVSPEAEVSVGVREYVSHAIIVSGMVKDPGTKILRREGVPLYVIVAHAQPLPGAGQVLVVSQVTGRTTAVNLSDTAAMNMLVRPSDVLTVQPLPKQFYYVAGAVRQPGQKEFHLGLTLTQALLAAGGAQSQSTTTPAIVTVTRQGGDGRLLTTTYNLRDIEAGRVPDPSVHPGDRVVVVK